MADRRDIVLICNPTAGGRWKELASILDSDEARFVRRIVTDSIEEMCQYIETCLSNGEHRREAEQTALEMTRRSLSGR